mgnify:CR=1 FL=1
MLNQNLYITYSNQKAREIKRKIAKPLDKIITLSGFVDDFFEKQSFKKMIDSIVASSFIFKTIKEEEIKYFDFINPSSDTLDLIYDFILKVNSSNIELPKILEGKKLEAIKILSNKYSEFKQKFNLVDSNDIVQYAIDNFEKIDFSNYKEIFLDSFENENIKFYKSDLEFKLLKLLFSKAKLLENKIENKNSATLYKLNKQAFDINRRLTKPVNSNSLSIDMSINLVLFYFPHFRRIYKWHYF